MRVSKRTASAETLVVIGAAHVVAALVADQFALEFGESAAADGTVDHGLTLILAV